MLRGPRHILNLLGGENLRARDRLVQIAVGLIGGVKVSGALNVNSVERHEEATQRQGYNAGIQHHQGIITAYGL